VVQWVPLEGEYKRWDALSGELVVASDGTVSVPVLGKVDALAMTPEALAADIAKRLKAKLGLVTIPDATVEILAYPPIYVVGAVTTPGEYGFKPGLTILQALALAGGNLRSVDTELSGDRLKLVGELKGLSDDIYRTTGRIARLQAEFSRSPTITFPDELMSASSDSIAKEIMEQEKIIFDARANARTRQATSLSELSKLIGTEIDVLKTKTEDLDKSIGMAETELEGVRGLVEKGVATVSRRSDLERNVFSLRSDRLDQLTATMRARQNQNEADRSLSGLDDEMRTEVAKELQSEQASLDRMRLQQATSQRLLEALDRNALLNSSGSAADEPVLIYSIVRRENGEAREIDATETTILMPDDVVKVAVKSRPALSEPAQSDGSGGGEIL
jgi:polysaccharide export outer membrane protein